MAKKTDQYKELSLFDDSSFDDSSKREDSKSQVASSYVPDELRSRSKRMRLRVTFADGQVICDVSATATMMKAIDRLGVERVATLGMVLCHVPLVSATVSEGFERWTKEIRPGWYLMAQSDTKQKYMQLKAIVDKLGEDVKVELGAFDSFVCSTDVSHDGAARKRKARLSVTFADGTEICKSEAMHTFVGVVEAIGVEKLKRTNLKIAGKDVISTVRKAKNQQQLTTGEWITVPSTIKDKYKVLRVISSMTHVPMDIKILE